MLRAATLLSLALLFASLASPSRAGANVDQEASTQASIITLKTPGPNRILIREGTFIMGSTMDEMVLARQMCEQEPWGRVCPEPAFADEYPPHEVYLSDYWLDRTEVTVAQYHQCALAGPCQDPPYASGGQRFDKPNLPVVLVTWFDANTYCHWVGGRLPTEAEWERAAKGPRNRRFPWGNLWNSTNANHGKLSWDPLDNVDGFLELAPIGSFPDGRTPDGFDDLAGNVEEWVADYYFPQYQNGSVMNPKGPPSGDNRVVRGGSFSDPKPVLRSTARQQAIASMRLPFRGFRCAYDP